MSDKYLYITEDAALEAMYAMPVGAIVLHDFTMYTKEDDDEWITALDAREYRAEDIIATEGLPIERIDLDPQMAGVVEDEALARAEAAEAANNEEDRL